MFIIPRQTILTECFFKEKEFKVYLDVLHISLHNIALYLKELLGLRGQLFRITTHYVKLETFPIEVVIWGGDAIC